MKANVKQISKHRHYLEEFKREIVTIYESGKDSVPQLEELYGNTRFPFQYLCQSFKRWQRY